MRNSKLFYSPLFSILLLFSNRMAGHTYLKGKDTKPLKKSFYDAPEGKIVRSAGTIFAYPASACFTFDR